MRYEICDTLPSGALDTCLSSGRLYRGGLRNVVGGNVFPPYEKYGFYLKMSKNR